MYITQSFARVVCSTVGCQFQPFEVAFTFHINGVSSIITPHFRSYIKFNCCQRQVQGPRASRAVPAVKNLPAKTGDIRDVGLIPEMGRSPGEENGNPLHYSCLENAHRQRSLAGVQVIGSQRVRLLKRLSMQGPSSDNPTKILRMRERHLNI